jgi:hypothetical protein
MTICLGELLYGSSSTLLTAASSHAGSPALCLDRPIVGKAQCNGDQVYTHTHTHTHMQARNAARLLFIVLMHCYFNFLISSETGSDAYSDTESNAGSIKIILIVKTIIKLINIQVSKITGQSTGPQ